MMQEGAETSTYLLVAALEQFMDVTGSVLDYTDSPCCHLQTTTSGAHTVYLCTAALG